MLGCAAHGVHHNAMSASLDSYISPWLYTYIVIYGDCMSPEARLDATFAALADPTRRAILARLASGEASVSELAEPFDLSQPAISKHLKVLERAGLISTAQDAQRRPRRLEPEALDAAVAWIERYREVWAQNFARLDALLDELKAAKSAAKKKKKRRT